MPGDEPLDARCRRSPTCPRWSRSRAPPGMTRPSSRSTRATLPETRRAQRVPDRPGGLTNARKHARGTAVDITVAGEPGDGLTIEMRNPLASAPQRR